MYRYKLVQLHDNLNRDNGKSWYAVSNGGKPLDTRAMTRAAVANTSFSPYEMEAALELLGDCAIEQLLQGHIVRLGSLGSIRITFQSEGTRDITQFDAKRMIHHPRIVFKPSNEFRRRVLGSLQFHNGGVLEDGVSYASISDYLRAKGADVPANLEAT